MKHLKDKNRPWLKATKTRYMHRRSRCSMLPCIFPLRQKGINLSLKLFVVKQLLSGCRSNLDHLKDDHFHSAAIWYSNCENKCAHTQGSDRRPLNPATTHCCLLHQQWSKQKYYCQPSSTHKQQTAAGVCVYVGWINRPVLCSALCFIWNLHTICVQIKTTYCIKETGSGSASQYQFYMIQIYEGFGSFQREIYLFLHHYSRNYKIQILGKINNIYRI